MCVFACVWCVRQTTSTIRVSSSSYPASPASPPLTPSSSFSSPLLASSPLVLGNGREELDERVLWQSVLNRQIPQLMQMDSVHRVMDPRHNGERRERVRKRKNEPRETERQKEGPDRKRDRKRDRNSPKKAKREKRERESMSSKCRPYCDDFLLLSPFISLHLLSSLSHIHISCTFLIIPLKSIKTRKLIKR